MPDVLVDDAVLLVFGVIALGAAAGSVRLRGVAVGPAAALFIGLAVSAVREDAASVEGLATLREVGLVLFTYTIGLASGPTFLTGLRQGGGRAVVATVGLVVALAGLSLGVARVLDLSAADRAGLFAGSTTNTPALQAAVESATDGDPVVAYSLAYPAAIASMLVVLTLLLGRRLPLPARLEPPEPAARAEPLVNWTVRVTTAGLSTMGELREQHPGLAFSRIEHEGTVSIATTSDRLVPGDSVVAIGPSAAVEAFCHRVGVRSDRHLPLDRATHDFRRILVSDRRLAGARLRDLDLPGRFGVVATRLRRGDDDLLVDGDTEVQLGDRLRVVGPSDALGLVARELGDSEMEVSEVDAVGFALGVAGGLLLGVLAVPLPGGGDLSLGAAGGPLVAGLVLGALSRTGPVTWQLPRATNVVMRQIGLLTFLACAGLGSGATFADAVGTRAGLELLAAGSLVAAAFATLVVLTVQVVVRRDVLQTAGSVAGIETQPAALAFALDRADGDERINAAYALVFPAAMVAKIVVVQLLV